MKSIIILELFQEYNTVKHVCFKNDCELLKFIYADIIVSVAWTVYVNDNGSNICFLRNNVWNVLFSDVWSVMQFGVRSIISVSLIFFKILSGVWLFDIYIIIY